MLQNPWSQHASHNPDWKIVFDLILHFARNTPCIGFTSHELLFSIHLPSFYQLWNPYGHHHPPLLLTLHNSFTKWTLFSHAKLYHVKSALSSKLVTDRITKETTLLAKFNIGDIVYETLWNKQMHRSILDWFIHYHSTFSTWQLFNSSERQED